MHNILIWLRVSFVVRTYGRILEYILEWTATKGIYLIMTGLLLSSTASVLAIALVVACLKFEYVCVLVTQSAAIMAVSAATIFTYCFSSDERRKQFSLLPMGLSSR
jgi:hypothetical protein